MDRNATPICAALSAWPAGMGLAALRHSLLTPLPTSVLKMLWKKATMVLMVCPGAGEMPSVCWSAACSSALQVTSRSTVLCGAARKPARMSAVPTAADVYEMRLLSVMVPGVHSVGAAWRCLSSLRIYPAKAVLFHTPSGTLRSITTVSPTSELRVLRMNEYASVPRGFGATGMASVMAESRDGFAACLPTAAPSACLAAARTAPATPGRSASPTQRCPPPSMALLSSS